jgi:pullulanase
MTKKLIPFALLLLSLPLVSCGPTPTSSAASSASKSDEEQSSAASSATPSSALTSSSLPASSTTPSSSSGQSDPPKYDEPSLSIHYQRPDSAYSTWALWLWEKGGEGKEFAFNGIDSYGAVAAYPLSTWTANLLTNGMGFIVKSAGSWASKDVSDDRFINFALYTPDANQIYNVYLVSGDKAIYDSPNKTQADAIAGADFVTESRVWVSTTNEVSSYVLKQNDVELFRKNLATPAKEFPIDFPTGSVGDALQAYSVEVTFAKSGLTISKSVNSYILYKKDTFKNAYTYEGNDLGAIVAEGKTTFKVWSPIASEITLNVYDNGTPASFGAMGSDVKVAYPMLKGEKGVWSVVVDGDLSSKYYTYFAKNRLYPAGVEIVDPYAKGCGVNGLRGLIVDFSLTNPTGWDGFTTALPIDRKSLVVDEMHIADLTSDSTWGGDATKAKKYEGFFQAGTQYTSATASYATGFDHIKELGVNAVQLQPIFDQANDEVNPTFNWGYNPLNYNCLEGSYSSDPYDGYARIKEFKRLVKAYYDAGINIIMDVVYNHTNSVEKTNFDVLCPGYFYRYTSAGGLYSGSGCGNDTASEMPMMRKFMLDSTAFWEKEYKLGGFRFDLMGLHDLETMNEIAAACKTINPYFCIYGEPWNLSTGLDSADQASQNNGAKWVGYGGFNDLMRDALIAGGLHAVSDTGWVANTAKSATSAHIINGVKGITNASILDPDKTTNYVTCHDNYTIYDRFYYGNGITDEALVKKMSFLAEAVALLSQGTSFFQGGEEFLRSKGGNSNSYNADYSVNSFKYDLKEKNADFNEAFRSLIKVKAKSSYLHLSESEVKNEMTSQFNASGNTLLTDVTLPSGAQLKMAMANGVGTPEKVDFTGYTTILDTAGATLDHAVQLAPFEVAVAEKSAS